MEFDLITLATNKDNDGYKNLLASANRLGLDVTNIWNGEPWQGLTMKPKLIKRYIEKSATSRKLIVFVDAYDVVFNHCPRRLDELFAQQKYPVLFAAEKNCYPRGEWAPQFPPQPNGYSFLNSGFIMGYTDAIQSMLVKMGTDDLPHDYRGDDGALKRHIDQEYFASFFLNNQDLIGLDVCSNFCLSLYPSANVCFEKNGIRYVDGDIFPVLLHGNGPSKRFLSEVWNWLEFCNR